MSAAWVAAVFGLVGAVIGALATGSTQLFLDWRNHRRAVARAKRLVAGELLQARIILRTIYTLRRWPSIDVFALVSTNIWEQQSFYLALLDPTVWNNLVSVYAELATLRVVAHAFAVGDDIQPATLATIKSTDDHLGSIRQQLGAQDVPSFQTPLPPVG